MLRLARSPRRNLVAVRETVRFVTGRLLKPPFPLTPRWPTMKSITNLLAPVALVVLFASSSKAQSQPASRADSSGNGSTPKVQAPAATPTDQPAATTPTSSTAKGSGKATLSRKSRKLPPPPPLSARRHTRPAKKARLGAAADNATDLDAYGRVDSAGKKVTFYPSARKPPFWQDPRFRL